MDMGIDERHSGLTSCQSQRPVLVLIPVKGIVTQNFKLQSFAFNQCSVLKETAFNKLISLKILIYYLETRGGFQVKQLASDFGQVSILLHNPGNRHLQVRALPNVDVHRVGFFVLRKQDIHGGLVKGAESDIERLHNSFFPRQGWFALLHRLVLVREEETEQIVPLPVSPRTVAEVRSFPALK
jgi:hypothetical protein